MSFRAGIVCILVATTSAWADGPPPAPFTVVTADVGGVAALRIDGEAIIKTQPALELGVAAGWGWVQRRPWGWDERAIMLRTRADYTASNAFAVRGAALDVTFQSWERIPRIELDVLVEFGFGACTWERKNLEPMTGHTTLYGFDIMASFGIPLGAHRNFLLALRTTAMNATHGHNLSWIILGDQHFNTYGVALSWQPSHVR